MRTSSGRTSRVVDYAAERDVFVWLDMEDYTTTDATLDAFEAETTRHDGGVGVCLQSNLRRTHDDLERLADLPGKVRLVKGAYDPPEALAYQGKGRVDGRFRTTCGTRSPTSTGNRGGESRPRDDPLARLLHEEFGTPYEIQMLMGVWPDVQSELAEDCEVWQYVPYGDRWLSTFTGA